MKNAAAVFAASYSDWKLIRGRKVVQVVFELPIEHANKAYEALGGMPNPAAESWFAICRLVQPMERRVIAETKEAQPASGDVPARASRNKLAQLAGMLGKEPLFHRYLEKIGAGTGIGEEWAVACIRAMCGITSRSQIIRDTSAGDKFLKLYNAFVLWRDTDAFVEANNV